MSFLSHLRAWFLSFLYIVGASMIVLSPVHAQQLDHGICTVTPAGRLQPGQPHAATCRHGTVCNPDQTDCRTPECGPVTKQCMTYRLTSLAGERVGGRPGQRCSCSCEFLVQQTDNTVNFRPCFGAQKSAWLRDGLDNDDALTCLRGLPAQ